MTSADAYSLIDSMVGFPEKKQARFLIKNSAKLLLFKKKAVPLHRI